MTGARDASPADQRVYRLKVTLQDVRPPIWRRFIVPDEISLLKLHELLQIIMGWTDSHLHEFAVGGMRFSRPGFELPAPREDEGRFRLRDVLREPSDRLVYQYDFGDGWEHAIVLEEILQYEPRERYPVIIGGKRACPPEDCGGPPGYGHLLQVLAKPDHSEHDELREWAGEGFDPERFDVAVLNGVLHRDASTRGKGKPRRAVATKRGRQTTVRPGARRRG